MRARAWTRSRRLPVFVCVFDRVSVPRTFKETAAASVRLGYLQTYSTCVRCVCVCVRMLRHAHLRRCGKRCGVQRKIRAPVSG